MIVFICSVIKSLNCENCGICELVDRLVIGKGTKLVKLHDLKSLSNMIDEGIEFPYIIVRARSINLDMLYSLSFIYERTPGAYFFILAEESDESTSDVLSRMNNVMLQEDSSRFLEMIKELAACNEIAITESFSEPISISPGVSLSINEQCVYNKGEQVILTRKEFDLLLLLLRSKGKYITTEDILQQVWDEYTAPEIVRQYVLKLRKKLFSNLSNNEKLIYRRGLGYTIV